MLEPEHTESFCDYCKQKVPEGVEVVQISVFWKDKTGANAQNQEFCSLKHARQWLLEFPYNKERVDFIVLPYIRNVDELKEFLS